MRKVYSLVDLNNTVRSLSAKKERIITLANLKSAYAEEGINPKKMLRYVKNSYFIVGKQRSSPRDGTQLDAFKLQCFHTLLASEKLLDEKVDAFVDMVASDMKDNGVRLVWETSDPESQESDEEREVFHAEDPSIR